MASEVDICNVALGYLGDDATVLSINPPDGSAQAEHCARFYPIARDSLLEMATWSFCMRRSALASVDQPWSEWLFAYALPSNIVSVVSVLPADATDDYSATFTINDPSIVPLGYTALPVFGSYTPQSYTIECDAKGNQVLYTNVEKAVLRYAVRITDPTQFGALFTLALTWHLASMLAGPIIKGDAGAAEAKRCAQMFAVFETQAEASDATQRSVKPQQIVPWMAGR